MSRAYVAIPIERIGTCDFCGITDHHLVDGVCPTCRPKTITVGGEATVCGPARRQSKTVAALSHLVAVARLALHNTTADDTPLGPEADVSHVRRPRGAR